MVHSVKRKFDARAAPAALSFKRQELEKWIEEAIAILDALDGEPDLEDGGDIEPSIGSAGQYVKGKLVYDLEEDMADDEHTLGWSNPMGLRVHVPEEARQLMGSCDSQDT